MVFFLLLPPPPVLPGVGTRREWGEVMEEEEEEEGGRWGESNSGRRATECGDLGAEVEGVGMVKRGEEGVVVVVVGR